MTNTSKTTLSNVANKTNKPNKKWLTIIGIGEDGYFPLSENAKKAIKNAKTLQGSKRQLDLIPNEKAPSAKKEIWPSPMMPRIEELINEQPENCVIIASGDPMCWGIGQHFTKHLKANQFNIIPSISILTQVSNLMQWPTAEIKSLSLCSQPLATLATYLQPNNKIIVLSANGETPRQVGHYLTKHGYAASSITILENIGSETQTIKNSTAENIKDFDPISPLNSLAIIIKPDPKTKAYTCNPGLPDDVFEHDGQITKQNIRAITLAHLRPMPGELLWDIGSGSGSIAIEWLRAGNACSNTHCRAIGFEKNQTRLERAQNNAQTHGVPHLELILGDALTNMDGLPTPDAIFIGGGITSEGLLETAIKSLKKGGRLVANTVTIEGTAKLMQAYKNNGGLLHQIAISNADQIGKFTSMRPQMPITQWVYNKSNS